MFQAARVATLLAIVTVLASVPAWVPVGGAVAGPVPAFSKAPIVFEGDASFALPFAYTGIVGGSGTASDPYVIEGHRFELPLVVVNAPTRLPAAITFSKTTAHVVVRGNEFVALEASESARSAVPMLSIAFESAPAIRLLGASNVAIESNSFVGLGGSQGALAVAAADPPPASAGASAPVVPSVVAIRGNAFERAIGATLLAADSDVEFSGNVVTTTRSVSRDVLFVSAPRGATIIAGNTLTFDDSTASATSPRPDAIKVRADGPHATAVRVTDNVVDGMPGIYVSPAPPSLEIARNVVRDAGFGYGISVSTAAPGLIEENVVDGAQSCALFGGYRLFISANALSRCGRSPSVLGVLDGSTNTLDGRPMVQVRDVAGGVVDFAGRELGWIDLVNATDVTLRNFTLTEAFSWSLNAARVTIEDAAIRMRTSAASATSRLTLNVDDLVLRRVDLVAPQLPGFQVTHEGLFRVEDSRLDQLQIRSQGPAASVELAGSQFGRPSRPAITLTTTECTPMDVSASRFEDTSIGIIVSSCADVTIRASSFVGSQVYAVTRTDGDATVDAVGNWWGSETGPRTPDNPSGLGDRLPSGIAYRPWLTSAPE